MLPSPHTKSLKHTTVFMSSHSSHTWLKQPNRRRKRKSILLKKNKDEKKRKKTTERKKQYRKKVLQLQVVKWPLFTAKLPALLSHTGEPQRKHEMNDKKPFYQEVLKRKQKKEEEKKGVGRKQLKGMHQSRITLRKHTTVSPSNNTLGDKETAEGKQKQRAR